MNLLQYRANIALENRENQEMDNAMVQLQEIFSELHGLLLIN